MEQGGVKKSALIEEFKKEHSGFVEAFKEVKGLGVQTKEGHTKLMSLLPDLLNHLWNEDKRLYPVLSRASEHNKKLKEILSFFVNGLGGIHEKILALMVKYSEGVKDNNFQRDYENFFGDLRKRIEYEENILFLEYRMLKY